MLRNDATVMHTVPLPVSHLMRCTHGCIHSFTRVYPYLPARRYTCTYRYICTYRYTSCSTLYSIDITNYSYYEIG